MSKIVPLEGFGGGSSSPLNFKIVAYATEEELAAAQPAENTIGVVTTTPINGWVFDTIEPNELIEGRLWIAIGSNNNTTFDVLNKNSIRISPLYAKHCVNSKWIDVIAYNFVNNQWIKFFEPGSIFRSGSGWLLEGNNYLLNANCIIDKNNIRMPANTDGSKNGFRTVNPVDFRGYNVLHIRLKGSGGGPSDANGFYFGFGQKLMDWPSQYWTTYSKINQVYNDWTELTLDISSGISNAYLRMFVYTSNEVNVSDIWLT